MIAHEGVEGVGGLLTQVHLDAQVVLEHLLHGDHHVPFVGRRRLPPHPEFKRGKAPAFRIPGFGQPLPGQFRIEGLVLADPLRLVTGKTLRQHAVGRRGAAAEYDVADGLAVDGVGEGLAQPHVVEGRFGGLEDRVVRPEVRVGDQFSAQDGIHARVMVIGAHDADPVELAVFIGGQPPPARQDEGELDTFEISLPRPVVVGIQPVGHADALVPRREAPGGIGHAILRLGPPYPVFLHLPPGRGHGSEEGQDVGKIGAGRFGFDHQRAVVHRPDADGRRVARLPRVEGPGALDRIVEVGEDVGAGGIEQPAEGPLEIVGGHRPAVAPLRALPDPEGPGHVVVRHGPGLGRRAPDLHVFVEDQQGLEEEGVELGVEEGYAHVQGGRFQHAQPDELLAQRGGVGREFPSHRIDARSRRFGAGPVTR